MPASTRTHGIGAALAAAALAAAVMVTAAACGGTPARKGGTVSPSASGPVKATVRWDLRTGHSVKQVPWRGPSSFEVGGGVQVNLRLPGGTFAGRVDRFGADRQGDDISDIVMFWPGASVADAYARAKRLGQAWGLDTHNLDTWYQRQKSNPAKPADLPNVIANSAGMKPTGPGGPIPSAEITYSFNEKAPAMVKLQFFWKPG
jgi:hypothetical protein